MAFAYLKEIQEGFQGLHGAEVQTVGRPYAFVRFDTFIQRTAKQYLDVRHAQSTRANSGLQSLNDNLGDVTRIMNRNISDVLGRGEHLTRNCVSYIEMEDKSKNLQYETKKYLQDSKQLNLNAFYQKYGPPAVIGIVVLLVFYVRIYWW